MTIVKEFLDIREAARTLRIGGGGRDVCLALTSSLDSVISSLVEETGHRGNYSVVAIGGYGRSELCLYSDVDLMLLHDLDDPAETASSLFRPLWDANLRLGHAVRTVEEAGRAARERFDTQTTLLTSRLVAGREDLFAGFTEEMASVTRARPLRRHLVREEAQRRRESPFLVMAAEVKNGRGGLRTLQGFDWERRREALIGRFTEELGPEMGDAHEVLLMVRNGLHAAAGRQYDTYSVDLRESVASWLGIDVFDISRSLMDALRTVDFRASRSWPEILEIDAPAQKPGKVWRRFLGRPGSSEESAQQSKDEFLGLLVTGEKGWLDIERLHQEGLLSGNLPEWDVIRGLPQLAPFHEHPVDAHLRRTVVEMLRLINGADGHYSAIAGELDSDDVLLLTAFLHDIGKGQGGDHSTIGADIARRFCGDLGCSEEATTLIEKAVRCHLLLSETATRRDLDDPAVIDEVVGLVGDLRVLQVLYLLTAADSTATGSTMWSVWKAQLVKSLFIRSAAHFGAERPLGFDRIEAESQVLAKTVPERRAVVESHLDQMPDDYVRSSSVDDVVWHVDLIEGLCEEVRSAIGTRRGGAADVAVVIGRDQPRFRRVVAEAFAANGIDVLEARLVTRGDGLIIDTFIVRDDMTNRPVSRAKWDRTRLDTESALAGELDTESKVVARMEAYQRPGEGRRPMARVSTDQATGDVVVTIQCADRIGRLAEILGVLFDCGLEIRLAKLDSRGGELVDTFHVGSHAISSQEIESGRLEDRIAASISV